ncbi:hypothetical protein WMF46_34705 [Sorangium sp. So ce117]
MGLIRRVATQQGYDMIVDKQAVDIDRKCAAQELGAVCRPFDSRDACVSKRRHRPPS